MTTQIGLFGKAFLEKPKAKLGRPKKEASAKPLAKASSEAHLEIEPCPVPVPAKKVKGGKITLSSADFQSLTERLTISSP